MFLKFHQIGLDKCVCNNIYIASNFAYLLVRIESSKMVLKISGLSRNNMFEFCKHFKDDKKRIWHKNHLLREMWCILLLHFYILLLQFGLCRINLLTSLSKIFFIVVRYNVNHVLNFRWIIKHKRKPKDTQNYKIYWNFLTEYHRIFSDDIFRYGIANCYFVFIILRLHSKNLTWRFIDISTTLKVQIM